MATDIIMRYEFSEIAQMKHERVIEIWGKASGKVNRASLIRSLIFAELDRCRRTRVEERTLRDLWYIFKPVLMRAEKVSLATMDDDKFKKWGRRAYQHLSSLLSELVLDGELQYSDLKVVDVKRLVDFHENYGFDGYKENILLVEKDGVYLAIDNFNKLYNITTLSTMGFCATSVIEQLAEKLNPAKNYKFLVFSDYDPAGFEIMNDLERRAKSLGINCEIIRIGITPDQVKRFGYKLEYKVYGISTPYKSAKKWIQKYGLFGKKLGIEIQAIEKKEELRIIVAEELEKHLDPRDIFEYYRKKSLEELPGYASTRAIDQVYQEDSRVKMKELLEEIVYYLERSLSRDQQEQEKEMFEYGDERIEDDSFDTRERAKPELLKELAVKKETDADIYRFDTADLREKLTEEMIAQFGDNVQCSFSLVKETISNIEALLSFVKEKTEEKEK